MFVLGENEDIIGALIIRIGLWSILYIYTLIIALNPSILLKLYSINHRMQTKASAERAGTEPEEY